MQAQWFETWFDSPWYPILYQHRDHAEAEAFVAKLIRTLDPAVGSNFLDLACGRGRHTMYIHQLGYDATGLDLSPSSIADAQAHKRDGLRFGVHDMRDPLSGKFDYILNLFTSFGYFDEIHENERVLRHVNAALNPNGTFVLDFMNAKQALDQLVPHMQIERQGVFFDITKRFDGSRIVKTIHLQDGDAVHQFEERVQALMLQDFQRISDAAGLTITKIWGDYAGGEFDESSSPRLILFMRHKDGQGLEGRP